MYCKFFKIIVLIYLFSHKVSFSQNTRINEKNTIGWYNYFGTFKLSKHWGIHTEYQWRRTYLITSWQQSLLRLGVNYQLDTKVQLRVGYGWIETFPYSSTPINVFGKDFTEHRVYQMVTLTDKVGIVGFSHRFMLEQRWIGKYSDASLTKEDSYIYSNRIRYMFRTQVPLKGQNIGDKTPYTAIYDELFIGFGKNVNANIFDQNRLGILLGYQFNKNFKLEGGYLNQIVMLGRKINNNTNNVVQYNSGIILNAMFNFDLSKSN
jgi:hypothetical protein